MSGEHLDGRRDIKEFLLEGLKRTRENALILDACAGDPLYQVRAPGRSYVTVDLCVGESTWDYSSIGVVGNLEAVPFLENKFDCIVFSQALEHMSEPEKALKELFRTLKPGGELLLTAPQQWYIHQAPYDFFRYTKYGLEHLLTKSGFKVKSIEPIGGYFRYLAMTLSLMKTFFFPKSSNIALKLIRWPFKVLFELLFDRLFPAALCFLDRYDKQKNSTMGYTAIGVKPV